MATYYVKKFGDDVGGYYYYGDGLGSIDVSDTYKTNATSAPGVDGEFSAGTKLGPKDVSMEGVIVPDDGRDLEDPTAIRDAWDAFMAGHRPGAPRRLYIHSDYYLNAEVRSVVQAKNSGGPSIQWTAQLHCSDPFWYSDDVLFQAIAVDGTPHSVATGGTAPSRPVVQFTVSAANGIGQYVFVDSLGNTLYVTPAAGQVGTWIVDCGQMTATCGGVDATGALSGVFLWLQAPTGSISAAITSGVSGSIVSLTWRSRKY